MHEKNKYRHIPWNRYNLEKYRDINFWSYRPALVCVLCISSSLFLFLVILSDPCMFAETPLLGPSPIHPWY